LKKVFAILLFAIHLFNVVGYRLAFSLAESNANERMITSLDNNNYNESDLVQIKLALNLPYPQNTGHYERCDGNLEYHGIQYNYVKRMVRNDTLYLYCIPNTEKTDIIASKNLYAKLNADNTSGKIPGQSTIKKINVLSDFYSGILSFNFNACPSSTIQNISFNNLTTLKGFITKHLQPPDLFI
jgi:hypothetical protein